jgi:hydroxypyruvate reductase/glycerate 2-kinase
MIIKNAGELASTPLRKQVLDIIEAGITRVLPQNIIETAVKYDPLHRAISINGDKYDISRGRVFVVGGGKAAAFMAKKLEEIISPQNITAGVVNSKNIDCTTEKIKIVEAGHPLPDERGVRGVRQMLALKRRYAINADDFVISLISGGGSALMPNPVKGVSLKDKQTITSLLLQCGATIKEINAIRKHLSQTKGGGLGRYFAPATVVSLILSDVIGNDLGVIASGQTCPDSSTFSMAYDLLKRYKLIDKAPKSVINHIMSGCQGKVEETPKSLSNCCNYIIGDNTLSLQAMSATAVSLGFKPFIITAEQAGETTSVARQRADEILQGKYMGYDLLLIGGETTPVLPSDAGTGGRNQQYAAVSLLALETCRRDWVVTAVGTDGSDFLPDVAGAIVDEQTLLKTRSKGIDITDYINRYDSNTLFKEIGSSLIYTGSTGTNVGDIIVYAFN